MYGVLSIMSPQILAKTHKNPPQPWWHPQSRAAHQGAKHEPPLPIESFSKQPWWMTQQQKMGKRETLTRHATRTVKITPKILVEQAKIEAKAAFPQKTSLESIGKPIPNPKKAPTESSTPISTVAPGKNIVLKPVAQVMNKAPARAQPGDCPVAAIEAMIEEMAGTRLNTAIGSGQGVKRQNTAKKQHASMPSAEKKKKKTIKIPNAAIYVEDNWLEPVPVVEPAPFRSKKLKTTKQQRQRSIKRRKRRKKTNLVAESIGKRVDSAAIVLPPLPGFDEQLLGWPEDSPMNALAMLKQRQQQELVEKEQEGPAVTRIFKGIMHFLR
jgi:hypothetical protein